MKTVLVLEDNLVELDIFKDLLGDKCKLLAASRTDIASTLLNDNINEIDCIVFDLNMNNEFISKEYKDKTMMAHLLDGFGIFIMQITYLKINPILLYLRDLLTS